MSEVKRPDVGAIKLSIYPDAGGVDPRDVVATLAWIDALEGVIEEDHIVFREKGWGIVDSDHPHADIIRQVLDARKARPAVT